MVAGGERGHEAFGDYHTGAERYGAQSEQLT